MSSPAASASSNEEGGSVGSGAGAGLSSQPVDLTAAQVKELQAAVGMANKATSQALQLGTLTALTGSYRDIHVTMEALYHQQVAHQSPLQPSQQLPAQPQAPGPKDNYLCNTSFPALDLTTLPDNHQSLPKAGQQFDTRYMDKITAWLQMQPNHVETSVQLQTGINLFPPQEASYPTYVDFTAAMRLLEIHRSRKRIAVQRKLRNYQDKYQLRTWDHRKGEV
eukprot:CAMPEP_0119103328 /NCGR_PEP_ID=MMETSP1180-20130426/1779_1 /TAXON_ID=3052 ORGANISM="Chlamydomonas cf sp, Strain CCMP681" /NCGR_SAMPLE_ID=MMETSP1180 /ASSEMBLY_ACC=CAM_ASM_000741 /LENGTH=221 /DNA_ID=CAMNT_0007087793 /DNA_START=226 /DNA_END=891 /DNA_ORIENTATION=+